MHLQVRGASCPEADWDGWLPAGLNAPTGARRFLPVNRTLATFGAMS